MAQQTIVELVDDIHGGPATETVPFAIDGRHLVIDLDDANATQLRETLAPYIDRARHVGGRRRRRQTAQAPLPKQPGTPPTDSTVRQWAVANGIAVNARGRVRQAVIDQYLAATKRRRR
jgi:Lsr2